MDLSSEPWLLALLRNNIFLGRFLERPLLSWSSSASELAIEEAIDSASEQLDLLYFLRFYLEVISSSMLYNPNV